MNILVTGGAGFIGSHLIDALLKAGHSVTAIDNLSLGRHSNIAHLDTDSAFNFVEGDVLDTSILDRIFAEKKIEAVFHMAANSDIARSHEMPQVDFDNTFMTTFRVLEAMRTHDVKKLVFASTSAIYGETAGQISEDYGPLRPISHYGAAKLSSEAFITSYSENYGIQAWITRFPNVVGSRATHGAVFDFVRKLKRSPGELEVLGNGTQIKPYLWVEDLVAAILLVWQSTRDRINVFNVGAETRTTVADIARTVIEESDTKDARINYTGGDRGWIGDVPKFEYDISAIKALGWEPTVTSDDAIRLAARAIWSEQK